MKSYVLTIQDSDNMQIYGFIYIAVVSSKKKAEKITEQVEQWHSKMKERVYDKDGFGLVKSPEEIRSILRHNEPPDIGIKWNYGDLGRFLSRGCNVCCEAVSVI